MTKPDVLVSKSVLRLKIGLLASALLLLVASFIDLTTLWGLNSWGLIAWQLRIGTVIGIVCLSLPRMSEFIGRILGGLLDQLRPVHAAAVVVLGTVLLLFGFTQLESNNHALGDGYNILGNLKEGAHVSATEPLSYLLHANLIKIVVDDPDKIEEAFRVSSLIAAIAFFGYLIFWLRDRRYGLISLAAILGFAVLQFFAGYVENYTYSFLFSFFYLAQASRDVVKNVLRPLTILLLVIAVGFHFSAAVFLPVVVLQFWLRFQQRGVRFGIVIAAVILGAAGVLYIAQSGLLSQAFVPLYATSNSQYHMFSIAHILDLLNLVILLFPLLPVFLLTPVVWRMPERNLIGLALIMGLIFMIAVDPKIGAYRDWDLLSIASAPAMVVTLLCIEKCAEWNLRQTSTLFLPLLLFGLLHTGSWIWSNTFRNRSYETMLEYVKQDAHYRLDYYQGTRLVPWSVMTWRIYHDSEETVRAGKLYLQTHPLDHNHRLGLAGFTYDLGRIEEAAQLVTGVWKYFPPDSLIVRDVSKILYNSGRIQESKEVLVAGLGYFPADQWMKDRLVEIESRELHR